MKLLLSFQIFKFFSKNMLKILINLILTSSLYLIWKLLKISLKHFRPKLQYLSLVK